MGKKTSAALLWVFSAVYIFIFPACDSNTGFGAINGSGDPGTQSGSNVTVVENEDDPDRDNTPRVLENLADGLAAFSGNGATVDYSYASDGYVMAEYKGDNTNIKLQITKEDGSTYTYGVAPNTGFIGFPLSADTGSYNIAMYLNIKDNQYSQACANTIEVDITDEFAPFLRPNQYSNFTNTTNAVAASSELARGAKSDLKVIENVFLYLIENMEYDYEKAANLQSGYIPDVDETLSTGKGICFDFAALMTCMMRSQGIPCQLVVGYAGQAYHAWISVYIEGIGWVANMIRFHGDVWTLMDPTFAAGGDRSDPNLIGDGETYNPVYYY